jgi:hypothetical protein
VSRGGDLAETQGLAESSASAVQRAREHGNLKGREGRERSESLDIDTLALAGTWRQGVESTWTEIKAAGSPRDRSLHNLGWARDARQPPPGRTPGEVRIEQALYRAEA